MGSLVFTDNVNISRIRSGYVEKRYQMKKNKPIIGFAILLLMLVLSNSCQVNDISKYSQESNIAVAKKQNAKGALHLLVCTERYGEKSWNNIIAKFKRVYQKSEVDYTFTTADTLSAYVDDIESGNYDFVFFDSEEKLTSSISYLSDITDWYNDNLSERIIDVLQPQKEEIVRGIPLFINMSGAWYNANILTKMNEKVPVYYEDLTKLKEKLGNSKLFICEKDQLNLMMEGNIFPALYSQRGKEIFENMNEAGINLNGCLDFTQILDRTKTLYTQGQIIIKDGNEALSSWAKGEAVFYIGELWQTQKIQNIAYSSSKLRFTAGVILLKNQKPCVMVESACVGITNKAKNKQNAFTFTEFLYQNSNLVTLVENTEVPTAAKVDLLDANISDVTNEIMKILCNPDMTILSKNELITIEVVNNSSNLFKNECGIS